MAKDETRNGQREYGIVHIVEEEMRAAGDGVYGAKNARAVPANKAEEESAPKAAPRKRKGK